MLVKESPFNLERLQREVNILLLSDLHYDIKREKSKDKWMHGPFVNNCIIKSLQDQTKDWEPDILIVAGDLVNQNKVDNYIHFNDLIKKLTASFPNLKNTFFSTPGNHDINRENIVSVFPYLYNLLQSEPGIEIENSYTNNQVVDVILTIARKSITEHTPLAKALIEFEREYFKTYLNQQEALHAEILHPHGKEEIFKGIKTVYCQSILGITLLSINSSFFCNISQSGQDRNNLFLIRDLVEEVDGRLKDISRGPVITFMHHPYYYLHESEHIAPASMEHKDKQNNFTKLVKKSDLILSGHVHGDLHDPTLLQQYAYMITNGTSYTTDVFEGKCYPYTYAMIKINKQLGKFSMRKFKYFNTGDSDASYAFSEIQPKAAKSYQFFEREGVKETTVETEKVSILYYFKKYYSRINKDPEWFFFIYQLRLYNKQLTDASLDYTIKEITLPCTGEPIEEISYNESTIWIFKMNKIGYQQHIEKVLSNRTCSYPHNCTLYFSIKMELLFDDCGHPSPKRIEHLRQSYQRLVMSMKNENASINLLYH